MTPEVQQMLEIAGTIIKAIIALAFSIITLYVKGMNSSVKGMNASMKIIEKDISDIKIDMSVNGTNMSNVKERICAIEDEQKDQLKYFNTYSNEIRSEINDVRMMVQKRH